MWYILSVEAQYHLPSYDHCTLPFMRDCLAGRKKLIKLRDLAMVNVPRLADFNTDNLYRHAMDDPMARLHLPDASRSGERTVSRKFLYNVSLAPARGQNKIFALTYVISLLGNIDFEARIF